MRYQVTMVRVGGVWRQMLIASDTEPVIFESNIIIQQGDGIIATYYTEGLYKAVEENGVYYYWFILLSKDTVITDSEKLAVYEEALNTLGVNTEEVTADAE